jgi:hypothetical protein
MKILYVLFWWRSLKKLGTSIFSPFRKVCLAVHIAHADNVLRGSSAADDVEAASSSAGMPSHATAFSTRTMGSERRRASSRGAACRLHVLCVLSVAWEFLVLECSIS